MKSRWLSLVSSHVSRVSCPSSFVKIWEQLKLTLGSSLEEHLNYNIHRISSLQRKSHSPTPHQCVFTKKVPKTCFNLTVIVVPGEELALSASGSAAVGSGMHWEIGMRLRLAWRNRGVFDMSGVIKWDPYLGGSNNADVWWFWGIFLALVHCLGR